MCESSVRPQSVLYCDPSFTCTGLCLINFNTRVISFDRIKTDFGTLRKYENYFRAGLAVADTFAKKIQDWQPSVLKIEIPPPIGQTAAGLTGLNCLLLARARDCTSLERTELINPAIVGNMQERYFGRFSTRSQIAQAVLVRMVESGQVVGTVNPELLDDNDVATAFLFYVFEKLRRQEDYSEALQKAQNPRSKSYGKYPEPLTGNQEPLVLRAPSPFTVLPTKAMITTTSNTTEATTLYSNESRKSKSDPQYREILLSPGAGQKKSERSPRKCKVSSGSGVPLAVEGAGGSELEASPRSSRRRPRQQASPAQGEP